MIFTAVINMMILFFSLLFTLKDNQSYERKLMDDLNIYTAKVAFINLFDDNMLDSYCQEEIENLFSQATVL